MKTIETLCTEVVVVGGGVAGVAAALAARRAGRKVLLLEKSTLFGGLATIGVINFFVPMDNGAGKLVSRGMAEEFLHLSVAHGFDSFPPEWAGGEEPVVPTKVACTTSYSPYIFALELMQRLVDEGVQLRYDTLVSDVELDAAERITAITAETKSGTLRVEARVFIDATGDAILAARAGAPCEVGQNYFSYFGRSITVESCKRAAASGNISHAYCGVSGGTASLSGDHHPAGMPTFPGADAARQTEFLLANQQQLLASIRGEDRFSREVVILPWMEQYRTSRHLVGAYTLTAADANASHPDSIALISDFCKPTDLYEVPYGTLYHEAYPNLLAVGRCASASGYGWEVLRVIPPAILTGQAAGNAAALALEIDADAPVVPAVPMAELQRRQAAQGVLLHATEELRAQPAADTATAPSDPAAAPTPSPFSAQLSAE